MVGYEWCYVIDAKLFKLEAKATVPAGQKKFNHKTSAFTYTRNAFATMYETIEQGIFYRREEERLLTIQVLVGHAAALKGAVVLLIVIL